MGNTIRARLFITAAIGLVALAVLLLSWPRFLAAFRYLPVDIAVKRYYVDRQIPSDRLVVLKDFAQQAIDLHGHYRYHDGLSQVHNLRALDPFTPAMERRPAYQYVEAEASASLQQAPAQSAVWLRLARIRWVLHDEPQNIIQPWKMSIFTGRTESSLFGSRVEIGLAHYGLMDGEAVAMLRDQLLLAWRARAGSLVNILSRRDPNLALTRELLAETDPLALSEMEAWLEEFR